VDAMLWNLAWDSCLNGFFEGLIVLLPSPVGATSLYKTTQNILFCFYKYFTPTALGVDAMLWNLAWDSCLNGFF
jgi:hypothetical protein